MNDSDKRMVKLEQQLAAQIQKGNPEVIRRMTSEQATFVKDVLHYQVNPYIYEVRTQKIGNVSGAMWLLKEVHRAYRKGQKTIYKRLRAKEVGALERAGIKFRPVKYRIVFNAV